MKMSFERPRMYVCIRYVFFYFILHGVHVVRLGAVPQLERLTLELDAFPPVFRAQGVVVDTHTQLLYVLT